MGGGTHHLAHQKHLPRVAVQVVPERPERLEDLDEPRLAHQCVPQRRHLPAADALLDHGQVVHAAVQLGQRLEAIQETLRGRCAGGGAVRGSLPWHVYITCTCLSLLPRRASRTPIYQYGTCMPAEPSNV